MAAEATGASGDDKASVTGDSVAAAGETLAAALARLAVRELMPSDRAAVKRAEEEEKSAAATRGSRWDEACVWNGRAKGALENIAEAVYVGAELLLRDS